VIALLLHCLVVGFAKFATTLMHMDHARDRAMEKMRQSFLPPALDDCNFDITEMVLD